MIYLKRIWWLTTGNPWSWRDAWRAEGFKAIFRLLGGGPLLVKPPIGPMPEWLKD